MFVGFFGLYYIFILLAPPPLPPPPPPALTKLEFLQFGVPSLAAFGCPGHRGSCCCFLPPEPRKLSELSSQALVEIYGATMGCEGESMESRDGRIGCAGNVFGILQSFVNTGSWIAGLVTQRLGDQMNPKIGVLYLILL